jgi:hypothetical protein
MTNNIDQEAFQKGIQSLRIFGGIDVPEQPNLADIYQEIAETKQAIEQRAWEIQAAVLQGQPSPEKTFGTRWAVLEERIDPDLGSVKLVTRLFFKPKTELEAKNHEVIVSQRAKHAKPRRLKLVREEIPTIVREDHERFMGVHVLVVPGTEENENKLSQTGTVNYWVDNLPKGVVAFGTEEGVSRFEDFYEMLFTDLADRLKVEEQHVSCIGRFVDLYAEAFNVVL